MSVIEQKASTAFEIVPSIDLIGGQVVRLRRGAFDDVTVYGDPVAIASAWKLEAGRRLHVVDLEASRQGRPVELDVVSSLAALGVAVQIGGGIRSAADARAWIHAGAARVVVGTVAAHSHALLSAIVDAVGPDRVTAALDLRDGVVRVEGWEKAAGRSLDAIVESIASTGIDEMLVTDIRVDGTMLGPSLDLYRELVNRRLGVSILASGGVGSVTDLEALARIEGLSGVIVGRALHEGRIDLRRAETRLRSTAAIPRRVIPCLDVRGGRVVKGVRFESIRDAGDPVECAVRYEEEGADELIVLDISATQEERSTSLETIHRISESLFIPLTAGGGVRSIFDFRALLRGGADRVAINTAAVLRPDLIDDCAKEFGVQAVVLACDARLVDGKYRVVVRAGTETVTRELREWVLEAESRGAGEILLTSIDRDGTKEGFDLAMLREITGALRIGVIASGGAGQLAHFSEAIDRGGARAVLAASLFHDRVLRVGDVKSELRSKRIAIRKGDGLAAREPK